MIKAPADTICIKGNGIHYIHHVLKSKGELEEQKFLATLTPEEAEVYTKNLPISWIPMSDVITIYTKAVNYIYSDRPFAWVDMGKGMAIFHFNGMYKYLLKIASVSFIMQQSAKIWGLYFNQGKAQAVKPSAEKAIHFMVRDFPELPLCLRKMSVGFIHGILSLTEARNVRIHQEDQNPNEWKWVLTWE
jgi:hypothetical protein